MCTTKTLIILQDEQVDLSLRWAHMSDGAFSYFEANFSRLIIPHLWLIIFYIKWLHFRAIYNPLIHIQVGSKQNLLDVRQKLLWGPHRDDVATSIQTSTCYGAFFVCFLLRFLIVIFSGSYPAVWLLGKRDWLLCCSLFCGARLGLIALPLGVIGMLIHAISPTVR